MLQPTDWLRIGMIGIILLAITAAFVGMISGFLQALILAAIFSAMAMPLYKRLFNWLGERAAAASGLTLTILIFAILIPALLLLGLIAGQAADLATMVESGAQDIISGFGESRLPLPDWFPFGKQIEDLVPRILSQIAGMAGEIGGFILGSFAAITKGAAQFFLQIFVMIYAMFFFLKDGPNMIEKFLRTTTLDTERQRRILHQGYVAAYATIKGSLVIGAIQGFLGGLGFWVTGIPNAALWGLISAIASLVPGLGTAIVWVPGVIYLFAIGESVMAMALAVWSMILVGSIDNLLRPRLVGGAAKMSDLVILVSTFGGLATFGATGLILGPAIAAMFFAAWDVFYEANTAPSPSSID